MLLLKSERCDAGDRDKKKLFNSMEIFQYIESVIMCYASLHVPAKCL